MSVFPTNRPQEGVATAPPFSIRDGKGKVWLRYADDSVLSLCYTRIRKNNVHLDVWAVLIDIRLLLPGKHAAFCCERRFEISASHAGMDCTNLP